MGAASEVWLDEEDVLAGRRGVGAGLRAMDRPGASEELGRSPNARWWL